MAGLSRRAFLATGAALAACRPADPVSAEAAAACPLGIDWMPARMISHT